MRLITFTERGCTRAGFLVQDGVVDLTKACPSLPADLLSLIQMGEPVLTMIARMAGNYAHDEVILDSVIKRPPKIIAIGLNYRAHAEESNMALPEVPLVFTKQSTSANVSYSPIYWSEEGKGLGYEGELALVIARNCRRVTRDQARGDSRILRGQ